MPLSLSSRYCGNVYVIQCKGRIVAGDEVRSLESALDLGACEFSRMVLHVGEVDRVDSSGLGLLVRYAAKMRKRGGDMRLAAPPQFFVTLMELTKLTSVLAFHPTEEEAIVSFLKERAGPSEQKTGGASLLVLDPSADLCAFVRAVLVQHGYDVKSANRLTDAKILLRVEPVETILLGPNVADQGPLTLLEPLKSCAPKAKAVQLAADFKHLDAHAATQVLLQLLGTGGGA